MHGLLNKPSLWFSKQPIVVGIVGVFATLGYINLYFYGFRLGVSPAIRPFLDGYFYSTIAIDFFVSPAVAFASAKAVVLFIRLFLSENKYFFRLSNSLTTLTVKVLLNQKDPDKALRVYSKLVGRWVRQKGLFVTPIIAFLVFSWLFFGRLAIWFVPICILSFLFLWAVVSRVELRRSFATPGNTAHHSVSRIYLALIRFTLVYLALCFWLAGYVSFAGRFDTKVEIGMDGQLSESSLIAVTSSGILVGEASKGAFSLIDPFSASLDFLPFDSVDYIRKNY